MICSYIVTTKPTKIKRVGGVAGREIGPCLFSRKKKGQSQSKPIWASLWTFDLLTHELSMHEKVSIFYSFYLFHLGPLVDTF